MSEAVDRGKVSKTLWNDLETTTNGTARIKKLFGDIVFSNPKPVQLLERIIELGGDKNGIILDFFSGSATTAEAVIKKNSEDGGNRKFILVQLPEDLDNSLLTSDNDAKPVIEKSIRYLDSINRPRLLTEIGLERIRLAIDDLKLSEDIGFKVFELDKSNIKRWNAAGANLIDQIEMLQDNFESGSTPLDVVYEIVLKQGLSLTSNIIEEKVGESVLYTIENGSMFIVLGNKINSSVASYIVDKIKELDPEDPVVVFQDQQFESDSEKLNAIEILNENDVKYDNILSI